MYGNEPAPHKKDLCHGTTARAVSAAHSATDSANPATSPDTPCNVRYPQPMAAA